jgi:hypothetical protein
MSGEVELIVYSGNQLTKDSCYKYLPIDTSEDKKKLTEREGKFFANESDLTDLGKFIEISSREEIDDHSTMGPIQVYFMITLKFEKKSITDIEDNPRNYYFKYECDNNDNKNIINTNTD